MNTRIFEIQRQLSEVHERYKCVHRESEVRQRTLSNGSIQYIHQCTRCGRPVGHAISKKRIAAEFGGAEGIPAFDEKLAVSWNTEYQRKKREVLGSDHETNKEALSRFWEWYTEYLESPEWKSKRRRVLKRANGLCEGCGEREPTDVHHLTYRHKGNEFMFELVALCVACHDKIHSEHENKSIDEIQRL